MAKRRHNHGAELPFVALMDTMTNVVGVLTVVLVMIGISIAHAVKKILTDFPPVTAAQVAESQASIDKTQAELAALAKKATLIPNLPSEGDINAELIKHTKVKGKPDNFLYDGRKIIANFQNFNWGNSRGKKISIQPEPTNYFLWLVIRPNLESGGTPLDEITQPDSEFIKSLPVIRQSFRSILLYRVHTDSFKTYLAARELSEKANIPAGWDVNFSLDYRMPIPEVKVQRLKQPLPKPNTPASPPRPKPGLD